MEVVKLSILKYYQTVAEIHTVKYLFLWKRFRQWLFLIHWDLRKGMASRKTATVAVSLRRLCFQSYLPVYLLCASDAASSPRQENMPQIKSQLDANFYTRRFS